MDYTEFIQRLDILAPILIAIIILSYLSIIFINSAFKYKRILKYFKNLFKN